MKKILITIFTVILSIVIAVLLKNIYSKDIPISNRGINDAINSGKLDILFVGSSTFRADIDMPTIDEAHDGRVYNISYGGNHFVANTIQYDEIKKRKKSNIDLFIFELGPLILTEPVKLTDSRMIWDLSLDGKIRLWKKMAESGSTTPASMYEYFVTSGMDDILTYPVTEPIYSTRYYKGAKTDETPSPGLEYLENENFDISDASLIEAQEAALREMIANCQKDGQKILFLECPHYYRLQENYVYQKYRNIFISILEENNVDYILADDVDFDDHNPNYFEDMNHLSYEGRKLYTEMLIKVLDGK